MWWQLPGSSISSAVNVDNVPVRGKPARKSTPSIKVGKDYQKHPTCWLVHLLNYKFMLSWKEKRQAPAPIRINSTSSFGKGFSPGSKNGSRFDCAEDISNQLMRKIKNWNITEKPPSELRIVRTTTCASGWCTLIDVSYNPFRQNLTFILYL